VNGAVYLAGNWRPVETTPAGPGWWTDSDECSTLLIDLVPAAHALEAEIYVTHFVTDLSLKPTVSYWIIACGQRQTAIAISVSICDRFAANGADGSF
jgi:hypothetical protein